MRGGRSAQRHDQASGAANFSHPHVLAYPSNGFPTDKPRPQLQVRNLTGFSSTGGTGTASVCGTDSISGPNSNQEWAAVTGVLTH